MVELVPDRLAIKARQVRPGKALAVTLREGQLLQIADVDGKQVADFVAFSLDDPSEHVSTAVTRSATGNLIPQKGTQLWSNRRRPLLEIVEDTVGRHDTLYACCDPVRYDLLGAPGHANCRTALADALGGVAGGLDGVPDPVNWFMYVTIKQRGELDVREPLSEKGDFVLLKALADVVVAVSACPQDLNQTNGGKPTDILLRVYK